MAVPQQNFLRSIFSILDHLDPAQFSIASAMGISWVDNVLSSRYTEDEQYQIAGHLVGLLGNRLNSAVPRGLTPESIPRLLSFLQLSEKVHSTTYPPYPGAVALQLLSSRDASGTIVPREDTYSPRILPVLITTLSPTHTLQSRIFALKIFQKCGAEWLLPELGSFSTADRARLLEAVGDPFAFPPATSTDAKRLDYEPMTTIVLLIRLLSSDLWRDHVRYSNFSTCESVASTKQGRELALAHIRKLLVSFRSPQDITMVIRRLRELGCQNTAEVVLLWTWITGIADPTDHCGWMSIGEETLTFYRSHGVRRLSTLAQYIKHITPGPWPYERLRGHHRVAPCQVEGVQRRVRVREGLGNNPADWKRTGLIAMTCQLRRLYQLFGRDPITWEEMLRAGDSLDVVPLLGSGLKRDGRSDTGGLARIKVFDLACDYP